MLGRTIAVERLEQVFIREMLEETSILSGRIDRRVGWRLGRRWDRLLWAYVETAVTEVEWGVPWLLTVWIQQVCELLILCFAGSAETEFIWSLHQSGFGDWGGLRAVNYFDTVWIENMGLKWDDTLLLQGGRNLFRYLAWTCRLLSYLDVPDRLVSNRVPALLLVV